jgi:alkylation response protein AidB-like acyl-CoA dehydrogenase
MGPNASDLLDLITSGGGLTDPSLRQRAAQLYIESEILRLIRLRTVTAAIKGQPPGPEASVRKVLADEHGQHIMGLYKDLGGAHGMISGADDRDPDSVLVRGEGRWADPGIWDHGYLFAPALTIGGGTGDVQRNIIAERVLDLPHDIDVEAGKTWAESRRVAAPA